MTQQINPSFVLARDADEREKWIHALEETILRHTLQLQVRDFAWCLHSLSMAFFWGGGSCFFKK